MLSLRKILNAGNALLSTGQQAGISQRKSLSDILKTRLSRYNELLGADFDCASADPQVLALQTALASLDVLERVQDILLSESKKDVATEPNEDAEEVALGIRDTAQLRTLLAVVFHYGTEPILRRISASRGVHGNGETFTQYGRDIRIDLSVEDVSLLCDVVARMLRLALAIHSDHKPAQSGPRLRQQMTRTFISATLLSRHATELLRAAIGIGWMPRKLIGNYPRLAPEIRELAKLVLASLPPSQTIASLGKILSSSSMGTPSDPGPSTAFPSLLSLQAPLAVPLPYYVRRTCSALLSRQLLRPHGISGLLSAVFGEDSGAGSNTGATEIEAPLERLEHVARVLCAVPSGMDATQYFRLVIPRTAVLLTPSLSERAPVSHKRAAAFALSRMLTSESGPALEVAPSLLIAILHEPFLRITPPPLSENDGGMMDDTEDVAGVQPLPLRHPADVSLTLSPTDALHTLSALLTNADPSPALIGQLLTPLVPSLYSLHESLHRAPTADPAVRETVVGLLRTWARVVERAQLLPALWDIVEGVWDDGNGPREWAVDAAGELKVMERTEVIPKLALGDLARMQNTNGGEGVDVNANPLALRPDPMLFVRFVKSAVDTDVAAKLFVRLLESYREVQTLGDSEVDPRRTLLRLQLIVQMQTQLGDSASSTNILKKPTHILTFIKHALERSASDVRRESQSPGKKTCGLSKSDLRIVPELENEPPDSGDSDDEDAPGLENVERSEEMTVTAVNLLLSILEANPDLSSRVAPSLNDIFSVLEPIANTGSDTLRPLAREARLVMTARLASTSGGGISCASASAADAEAESPQETYQRALRLLQDPLLPVRAHGLLLLRELVSPHKETPRRTRSKESRSETRGWGSTQHGAPISAPALPPALVPGILHIFLEALQDADSYMFLNAVRGLAGMVDGYGQEVLRSLVDVYVHGLDSASGGGSVLGSMSQQEVDVRVRVGEALGQVIRRCGDALGAYVDIVVPPLTHVVRSASLPTTVRASAISLLAQCAETNARALAAYVTELVETMIDIVQLETVPATALRPTTEVRGGDQYAGAGNAQVNESGDVMQPAHSPTRSTPLDANTSRSKSTADHSAAGRHGLDRGTESRRETRGSAPVRGRGVLSSAAAAGPDIDTVPTEANSKFPPLRRAALHFLALLVRSLTTRAYETGGPGALGEGVSAAALRRAETVLGYVAVTDSDGVVRVMAREAEEAVQGLRQAVLGL